MAAEFSVEPNTIKLGQKTTLSWKTSQPEAFISNIGIVPSAGQLTVEPSESTNYWFVVRNKSSITVVGRKVTVEGGRGPDEVLIDLSIFPLARRLSLPNARYENFLESVERVLDDKWKMTPIWMRAPSEKQFTAVTQSVSHNELVANNNSSQDWKVAFLLKIQDPIEGNSDGEVNFQVSTAVSSRKRNELNYTAAGQSGESVARTASDKLLSDLKEYLGTHYE
ncbi:hypothetical protein F6476_22780 [Pseudomonas umsongensis]|uniref:hypothetical protein n=1 Tax=Pseudomonas umsongensis TaxID=198618 RepID=UPI00124659DF|nr:hypothetical protein [Pseudomonas umsongensis]QFG31796.1 hypothetical protein F6476_22780 [Pseudomonas umsongensis]